MILFAYIYVYLVHLNCAGVGPNKPPLCLLAARDGAKPNSFWIF